VNWIELSRKILVSEGVAGVNVALLWGVLLVVAGLVLPSAVHRAADNAHGADLSLPGA